MLMTLRQAGSHTFRVTEPKLTQEDLGDIRYMSLVSPSTRYFPLYLEKKEMYVRCEN